MSEQTFPTQQTPAPESQQQRWIKYGGNVLLASVIVILLAVAVTYIASTYRLRRDMTQAGLFSLKPQTKAILKDLDRPVKLVSLYTRAESTGEQPTEDLAQMVSDLLDEYRTASGKITVDAIDPVKQPTKVDDLISEVTEKYGGEVRKYKDFLDKYPDRLAAIKKSVSEAAAEAPATPLNQSNMPEAIALALQTVPVFSERLDKQQESINSVLKQKPPDYKGATEAIDDGMDVLSQIAARIVEEFKRAKDDASIPQPLRTYVSSAIPKYEQIKKQADDIKAEIGKLGELKLDDLRQKLRERDAILVMGPNDMRTLSFDDVWQNDPNLRRLLSSPGTKIKPRFAGEQQITSAVLALTKDKKPKVAIVRGGGPPLATPGNPIFGGGGPLSVIAGRLRDMNFEVLEKDLSGMWAVQQQMQQRGMPPTPEPSDEEIKDAIWIVISTQQQPDAMGQADIGSKLHAHLAAGGSALVMFDPRGEPLTTALSDWGITARPDTIIVHEPSEATGAPSDDFINAAQRSPFVFVVNSFADHLITRPLQSLDVPMVAAVPVTFTSRDGLTGSPLIPMPSAQQIWGETNFESVREGNCTYDPKTDLPPPLFAGTAVEKKGAGRLVALGNVQFTFNDMLNWPDRELLDRGIPARRFPGSAELFVNSVLWLAKMEPMIAISPAAMDINRIKDIPPTKLSFLRSGLLLVGLPALVIVAGLTMYFRRRD